METARGRWFLEQYARRNSGAETAKVLAAIERIESVIRGKDEAYRSFRGELLDMAEAIARTRAQVMTPVNESQDETPAPPPPHPDVFAAAERIQDVAWAMRERGLDPRACEQIEAIATSILSASSLSDPNHHRAHKLGEVLQYLEHRINAMLEGGANISRRPTEEPTEERMKTAERLAAVALDLPGPGGAEPVIEQAAAGSAYSMPRQENTDSISDDARQPVEAQKAEPPSPVAAELASTASIPDPELPMDAAPPEVGSLQPEPELTLPRLATASEAIAVEPTDFLLAPLPPPIPLRAQPEPAAAPTTAAASAPPEETRDRPAPVAESQPAAAPTAKAPARDPLAPLRGMSDAERIALFS